MDRGLCTDLSKGGRYVSCGMMALPLEKEYPTLKNLAQLKDLKCPEKAQAHYLPCQEKRCTLTNV